MIAYVTNNIAPFRVKLLDELANHTKVTLYYVRELDKGVNAAYVSKRPEKATLQSIKQLGLIQTLQQLKQSDVVIFDGYSGIHKWMLMVGCYFRQIPFAISVDGIVSRESKGLKRWMKQFALRKARCVFSNDKRTDEILRRLVPDIVIKRHLFTTLSSNEVYEGLQKRQHILLDSLWIKEAPILFVGKFVVGKGVQEFTEATRNLNRKKIMIGGTMEDLNRLGITVDESYTVIPYATQEKVYSYMREAAVFVLPTYTDTWGLVIVEALSSGVPVVTTTSSNAGVELIQEGKTGFLVPKGEVLLLHKGIKKALQLNPQAVLEQLKLQMTHYTVEEAANKMMQSIQKEW